MATKIIRNCQLLATKELRRARKRRRRLGLEEQQEDREGQPYQAGGYQTSNRYVEYQNLASRKFTKNDYVDSLLTRYFHCLLFNINQILCECSLGLCPSFVLLAFAQGWYAPIYEVLKVIIFFNLKIQGCPRQKCSATEKTIEQKIDISMLYLYTKYQESILYSYPVIMLESWCTFHHCVDLDLLIM